MNRTAITAAAVAAVLAVLVILLATSETQQTSTANFRIVGEVAPQIEGPTLAGGTYDLQQQRGEWVVVNFFASTCVGCVIEHPELVEFNERHRNGDRQIVGVMFGDTEEAAREFFLELGGDWPAMIENTGAIAIDYGVTALPETLLVSPSGRVVQKWVGAQGVTADGIDAAIDRFENPSDSTEEAGGATEEPSGG